MKVFFIVPYPTEGASNRIRVEQYIPYLESRGVRCTVRPFVNRPFYKILYLPHRYIEKTFWFFVCTVNRLLDIVRALKYDIIFIHREAYPFGGPFIETMLFKLGKRIIFDFDDSIFLPNTSEHNIYIERFKKPEKVAAIIRMSSYVIAGNEYLNDYALKYNDKVRIIPSSIMTEKYRPSASERKDRGVVIGWVGSNTTKRFLYEIEDVLSELTKRYPGLMIKIIGADFYSFKMNNIINKRWSLEDEPEELRSIDIGVMPMPDNEWTRGKCAFKAIQYMASGLPVVGSPVGVNSKVIEEGVTGFLAKDGKEWTDKLSRLIADKNLRIKLGSAGRKKVEENYSVAVNSKKVFEVIDQVAHE